MLLTKEWSREEIETLCGVAEALQSLPRRGVGAEKEAGGSGISGVGVVAVGDGSAPRLDAGTCGDEPLLLARRNPQAVILVAPRR